MPVTLNQIQSLGPLQRQYKWDISFIWQPADMTITLATGEGLQSLLDEVNIRCISAAVPTPRFDNDVSASPHGVDIDEPGIVHLNGNIEFTIVETTDLKARKLLWYLQQHAMTDNDKVQYDIHSAGSSRANDLTAVLHRLDNYNRVNLTYECYKCFISGITDPAFESTTGGVQPRFTLRYNWFKMGFQNSTFTTTSVAGL